MQFHIARALELLKDHIIHPASRVNQGCRYDCKAAAAADIPGRTEKTFRLIQRTGIQST